MNPIDIREEAGVRTLHFGSDWIQGAMRIARPWHLELDYTQDMMASLLFRPDPAYPKRVLLIGLGAASLTKFLFRHRPLARLTVVEINPSVVAVARHFFKLPEDVKRLKIVIDDGAVFVAQPGGTYDLILVDGFDAQGKAGMLATLPFYQSCRARLSRNGILSVNLIGRSRGFKRGTDDLEAAFEGQTLVLPPCEGGNVIAFASGGDRVTLPLKELRHQAILFKKDTGLNLMATLTRLEKSSCSSQGKIGI